MATVRVEHAALVIERETWAALDRFLEAANKVQARRKVERLEVALQRKVARLFVRQGKAFLKRFKALKGEFKEAFDEDWQGYWIAAAEDSAEGFTDILDEAIRQALLLGGQQLIAELSAELNFDLKNPRAVDFLKEYAAGRVTAINETTRERLRVLITEAVDNGWSYDRLAQAISDRFEEFAVGKPQKHIESRAHLVAITEIGEAYSEGNLIVARDLQEAGLEMEKRWSTVGDKRVTAGCRENERAGWIPIGDEFPSGHQRPLRFPGCRCDALYRRKPS